MALKNGETKFFTPACFSKDFTFEMLAKDKKVKIKSLVQLQQLQSSPTSQWRTAFARSQKNATRFAMAGHISKIITLDSSDSTANIASLEPNSTCTAWFTPECLDELPSVVFLLLSFKLNFCCFSCYRSASNEKKNYLIIDDCLFILFDLNTLSL